MPRYLIIAASSSIGQKLVEILKKSDCEVIQTARDNSKISPDFILDAADFLATEEVLKKLVK